MQTCNHCQGSGFLNLDQVPPEISINGWETILQWLTDRNSELAACGDCSCEFARSPCPRCELAHDVVICDCCGDGDGWYGEAGQHYGADDPLGPDGPYASNGGLCGCN